MKHFMITNKEWFEGEVGLYNEKEVENNTSP